MKIIWFFWFFITICFALNAQEQPRETIKYPEKKLQLGWTLSNALINNDQEFHLVYRIKGRHALGFSFDVLKGKYKTKNLHPETFERGKGFGFYHKYYLLATESPSFLYFRHGVAIQKAEFSYQIEDFYEFLEDGSTFLRWENRSFKDEVTQAGYEVVIGGEAIVNSFFVDFYLGLSFNKSFQDEKYHDIISEIDVRDPRHNGPRFIGGFRLGFYFF